MAIGGCAILDEHGRILHVDRAMFPPATRWLGREAWEFAKNPAEAKKLKEAFAWAHSIGDPVTITVSASRPLPNREFIVNLSRIPGTKEVASRYAFHVPDVLSEAERRIVELIAHDHKPRDITATLAITLSTFETHRQSILKKLQVNGTAGITLWWAEQQRWR